MRPRLWLAIAAAQLEKERRQSVADAVSKGLCGAILDISRAGACELPYGHYGPHRVGHIAWNTDNG